MVQGCIEKPGQAEQLDLSTARTEAVAEEGLAGRDEAAVIQRPLLCSGSIKFLENVHSVGCSECRESAQPHLGGERA